MKFLIFCLLSSIASASPQEAAEEVARALAEARAELAAAQESLEAQDGNRYEQLGLQIAEEALAAVAEIIPEVSQVAKAALREAKYNLYADGRILIGITGGTPGAALCSHLGVDADRTIIVNSIGPGMSAEQAGLRKHDLIVAIDGHTDATMSALREIMASKEVGDVLQLTIISHGERREMLVPILEVQDWKDESQDPFQGRWSNALSGTSQLYYQEALRQLASAQSESGQVESQLAEAQAEVARAAQEIDVARGDYQRARAEFQRAAQVEQAPAASAQQQLLRTMELYESLVAEETGQRSLLRQMELRSRELHEQAEARNQALRAREQALFIDDGGGRWSTLFVPGSGPDNGARRDSNDRVERVEERVDELHARFDRLEEMLERLAGHRDN